MASVDDWVPIGRHLARVAPDGVFVRARGEILPGESVALCDYLLPLYQRNGWVFVILDASALTGMGAEARRENAAWHRAHRIDVQAVVFGAGLLVRTVFTLLGSAVRLLGNAQREIRFVATEADALAWVEDRRRAHAGGTGSDTGPAPPGR